jgi:hypothetical protein
MVVQAGLGKKLDMIDGGEEGQALASIEEEQKERVASAGSEGQSLRLMSPNSTMSPSQARTQQQKQLQSAGDAMYSPPPLYGLASQAQPTQQLSVSQSSATLPPVRQQLRGSESTPSLGYGNSTVSFEDDERPSTTGPARGTSSSGPRGKDGLAIEGAAARAAREKQQRGGSVTGGTSPTRGSTPSKGSTRLQSENTNLKVRAHELEKRLEQVSQHASLQAVHISALQSAVKSAHEGGILGSSSDPTASGSDGEGDAAGASFSDDESGGGGTSSHFFQPRGTSASSTSLKSDVIVGQRPASRGKLSPIKSSPKLNASSSTPSLGVAGSKPVGAQQLKGQNAKGAASPARVVSASSPQPSPSSGDERAYADLQQTISATLAGDALASGDDGGGKSASSTQRSQASASGGIAATIAAAATGKNSQRKNAGKA